MTADETGVDELGINQIVYLLTSFLFLLFSTTIAQ